MNLGLGHGLCVLLLLAAATAVFTRSFRSQVIALWVAHLVLGFLLLILGSEILAFSLSVLGSIVCWTLLASGLLFGDLQNEQGEGTNWRGWILPAGTALSFAGILYLGIGPEIGLSFPEVTGQNVEEFSSDYLSRFFIFSLVNGAVVFGAIVGAGMIGRPTWQKGKEHS